MARVPLFRSNVRGWIRAGYTPEAAYRSWIGAGGAHISKTAFEQVYGEMAGQMALAPRETARSLLLKPTAQEIGAGTFRRARGIVHEVLVIGRTAAGNLITKEVEVPAGEQPMSRLAAVRKAERWAEGFFSAEGGKQTDLVTVYGGLHVGTIRREPER